MLNTFHQPRFQIWFFSLVFGLAIVVSLIWMVCISVPTECPLSLRQLQQVYAQQQTYDHLPSIPLLKSYY